MFEIGNKLVAQEDSLLHVSNAKFYLRSKATLFKM